MSPELKKVLDMARPTAKELIQLASQDQTTKDGYGVIYSALTQLPRGMAKLILLACVLEGYPKETAFEIERLIQ